MSHYQRWWILGFLLLALAGHAIAQVTPAQARQEAGTAVDELIKWNYTISDEYFHTGQWDKSVAALERIIQLDPTQIDAYATAAWLLSSSGKMQEALTYNERMVNSLRPRH